MRISARSMLSIFCASVAVLAGSAATAAAAPKPASQHCAVIVSKELDEKGNSKVVAHSCSTTSIDEAFAQARSQQVKQASLAGVATPDATLLLNEYADANYNGGVIYSYYGNAGPCDSAGYHLVNFVSVEISVSSMTGYNGCDRVRVNDEFSNFGYFNLPTPGLGRWDNAVTALQVYRY